MTERSIESPISPGEAKQEYLRIYFREDPESVLEPDVETLKEVLSSDGIIVFETENNAGTTYIVDCHASGLEDLKEAIKDCGCWITLEAPRRVDPEIELPFTVIEEYTAQGPDTLILRPRRQK